MWSRRPLQFRYPSPCPALSSFDVSLLSSFMSTSFVDDRVSQDRRLQTECADDLPACVCLCDVAEAIRIDRHAGHHCRYEIIDGCQNGSTAPDCVARCHGNGRGGVWIRARRGAGRLRRCALVLTGVYRRRWHLRCVAMPPLLRPLIPWSW